MNVSGSRSGDRRRSDQAGMILDELLFEVFGSNFIERTGSHFGGNAQGLGLGENFFVLQAELF